MADQDGQFEADCKDPADEGWLEDVRDSLMFLTRLPVPARATGQHRALSQSARAFPIAGAVVGLLTGLALLTAQGAGLPAMLSACIALATGVLITGALHEDGLADVADGFGGGGTVDRKLEIMRDSRIGAYGVLALIFVVLIKVAALFSLLNAAQSVLHVPMMLVATGAVSRTIVVHAMRNLPTARSDGRSADAGQPDVLAHRQALVIGLGIGAAMLWLASGLWMLVAAFAAGFAAWFLLKRATLRHIGGQTGDVLGALQQLAETAMLIALCATYCCG